MEIVVDIVDLVFVLFLGYMLFRLGCVIIEFLGELRFARNAEEWSGALFWLIIVLIVFAIILGAGILLVRDWLNRRWF